jgi:hypothetical protein
MTTTVAKVPGIDKLSKSDLKALEISANNIGIPVDWLATVISFETGGTFSPKVKNKAGSGATGLIQFTIPTAQNLNTSIEELEKMSFSQQLKFVEKYFSSYKGRLKSLDDVYLAIFYPAKIGSDKTDIVATIPSLVYIQNAGFDRTGIGYFTVGDITRTINNLYNNSTGRISITSSIFQIIGGIFASGFLYLTWYKYNYPNTPISKQIDDKIDRLAGQIKKII